MQSKLLLFLIPFLGMASASHLVDSGTNKSVYSCEECKSFFNKLQLSDAGKLKSDLLGVCESVLPLVLTNRKEMCANSAENMFLKVANADAEVLCYAINSCPLPKKPEEELPKWNEADDCYFCAGVAIVASDSLSEGFIPRDFIAALHAISWQHSAKKLRDIKIDDETQPIAMNRFVDALAANKMDHKHALAYCNAIKVCKQFPFHM